MSIESAVVNRIKALIEKGMPLSPAGKEGYGLTDKEEQAIAGWLTSAKHAIRLVIGSPMNAYSSECNRVMIAYAATILIEGSSKSDERSNCVGEMVSILENLLVDVDAGLISSLEDRVRAETFDDFLDHAEKYHKSGSKKESGVIAGVVFEDTIRRIATNNKIPASNLDRIIDNLVKDGVITATKAKRAKACAHVRTKATHAQWEDFDLADVGGAITFIRELISAHLDH